MTFNEFKDFLNILVKNYTSDKVEYSEKENYSAAARCQAKVEVINCIIGKVAEVEFSENLNHNDFSWDNVKIDDVCIIEDYINSYAGKVIKLIYDNDGFCCGMKIKFSSTPSTDWADLYCDDDYKNFKQIGGWINDA